MAHGEGAPGKRGRRLRKRSQCIHRRTKGEQVAQGRGEGRFGERRGVTR